MQSQVEEVIGTCKQCKLKNAHHNKKEGLKHPIMKSRPFEQVCLDIVGPLPITSNDHRYVLTMIDRFTRYVEVVPLQTITAEAVADAYIDRWLCRYGPPREVLSDNGSQFTSKVFQMVQRSTNIKHKFASPYHPQCNGLIERFHRFLKQRLAIKAHTENLDFWDGDDWDCYLAPIAFAYNATPHPVNKRSPFELLYGARARLTIDIPKPDRIREEYANYDDYVFKLVRKLQIMRNETLRSQYEHQKKMKEKWNKDRRPFTFKVGQWVMKKVPYTGNRAKLQFGYDGPYEIIKKTGKGETYKIREIKGDNIEIVHGERLIPWERHQTTKDERQIAEIDNKVVNKLNDILLINVNEETTLTQLIRHVHVLRSENAKDKQEVHRPHTNSEKLTRETTQSDSTTNNHPRPTPKQETNK